MDERLRKADVDRLGEAMRQRDLTDDEVDLYNGYRDSFGPALASVLASLAEAGAPPATERQKTMWSTVAKLRRSTARLSQVQDIAGCRIVVALRQDQDALVERLAQAHAAWRVHDRRARPSHGYRGVHFIASADGRHVEVQVRTELQHLWAELSEAYDRLQPGVKYGSGPEGVLKNLTTLTQSVATVEDLEGHLPARSLEPHREAVRRGLLDLLASVRDFDGRL